MNAVGPLAVLLVEDDELQQTSVRRALEKAGITHPLFVAGDGVEALELLRSGKMPARRLVLLDVNMPRMDGLAFLGAVRADPLLKPLIVVMLTTSQEPRDKLEAQELNCAGYLRKSSDFPKFVEQLRVLGQYWSMMEIP